MGAKILQFYEKCKSCPKLFASKGKKASKGKRRLKVKSKKIVRRKQK